MDSTLNIPAIHISDLNLYYGSVPALRDVHCQFPVASLNAIIGPNGSGKSSLLKAILGLQEYTGNIRILGAPVDAVRNQIAYVPQRIQIDWQFPATVEEVVEMGRYIPGKIQFTLNQEDKACVQDALEKTGLTDLRKRRIGALSGGQQQRVFIARALAKQAEIYFMDEPFAGVDHSSEEKILEIMLHLKSTGKTLVVVHHDLSVVAKYFDYVLLLNGFKIAEGPVNSVMNSDALRSVYGMVSLTNTRFINSEEVNRHVE